MNYSKISTIFTLAVLISMAACRKEEEETISSEDETNARSYAQAESVSSQVFYMTLEAANDEPSLTGFTSGVIDDRNACPTVSVSPMGSYPKTLTLDYGTGCTTPRGELVSGTIIAVFSGPVNQSGTTISITFNNFKYKGYTLTGTYTAIVTTAGNYSVSATGASIATPDGKNITYNAALTVTQVEGQSTKGVGQQNDDVYTISTDATGTDSAGKTYSVKTTTPLRKEIDCEWIVSGTVEIKADVTPKKTIDFGTGGCDNIATLKVGLVTTTITLP